MIDSFKPAAPAPSTGLRSARQALSVAALLNAVADALAARFSTVTVQGELSGFNRAPSGHCYFSLKDDQAVEPALVRCAMFRRAATLLDFTARDGQLVEVRGRLAVYNARGDLQLVVDAMRPAGQGSLYEQFLRLKARLEGEGLFDPARKRPIVQFPRAVGVVTSLGAAALRDVVTAFARRAPQVQVAIYPATVQGVDAPAELVRAIELANARREVDTLIVCRGGGALEDLWAFNDERVARAIVASTLPVICGVGHETDVTIADFAADLRAPTPTAAAELAAPLRSDCLDVLHGMAGSMHRCVQRRLEREEQRLDHATLRLARPAQVLSRRQRELQALAHRLEGAPAQALQRNRQRELRLAQRLERAAANRRQQLASRLDTLSARLEGVNPGRVLQRGYAYLTDAEGRAIVSAQGVQPGQDVQAVLADGRLVAEVREVRHDDR